MVIGTIVSRVLIEMGVIGRVGMVVMIPVVVCAVDGLAGVTVAQGWAERLLRRR